MNLVQFVILIYSETRCTIQGHGEHNTETRTSSRVLSGPKLLRTRDSSVSQIVLSQESEHMSAPIVCFSLYIEL